MARDDDAGESQRLIQGPEAIITISDLTPCLALSFLTVASFAAASHSPFAFCFSSRPTPGSNADMLMITRTLETTKHVDAKP